MKPYVQRKPLRLTGYDYSEKGAYFITICTHNRACLFGQVIDNAMQINEAGDMVARVWSHLPDHYPQMRLDEWVVMPNHFHGIVVINDPITPSFVENDFKPPLYQPTQHKGEKQAGLKPAATHGIFEIVRGFKTFSSRNINKQRNMSGVPVWQRGYYDHIIRDEEDLMRIRQYIKNNPTQWAMDENNVNNTC
jgi:putative transposase